MKILSIDLTEIKRLKLNLNEYLTLLTVYGSIEYNYIQDNLDKLVELNFLNLVNNDYVLAPKAIKYFQASELFEKFYKTFPHIVPGKFGEERPLRAASVDTRTAAVTKSIWKKKVKGDTVLQEHIIDILEAEVDWRRESNSLQYMNNIDTWLRQNNWEKYEYLLNKNNNNFGNKL